MALRPAINAHRRPISNALPPPAAGFGATNSRPGALPPPAAGFGSPNIIGSSLPPPSAGFGSTNSRPGGVTNSLPSVSGGFALPQVQPPISNGPVPLPGNGNLGGYSIGDGFPNSAALPPPSAGFGSPNIMPGGLPPPAAGFGATNSRPGGSGFRLPPPSAGFGQPNVWPGNHNPAGLDRRAMMFRLLTSR